MRDVHGVLCGAQPGGNVRRQTIVIFHNEYAHPAPLTQKSSSKVSLKPTFGSSFAETVAIDRSQIVPPIAVDAGVLASHAGEGLRDALSGDVVTPGSPVNVRI